MNRRVLVLGFGNPGRQDDGLGPAMAAAVESMKILNVRTESNYQLCVEDAADAAEADVVIFADASLECEPPFAFVPIKACCETSFTSHHLSPSTVLALARDLFGKTPEGYILSVRGYRFGEFAEGLSCEARANLGAAESFIKKVLLSLAAGSGAVAAPEGSSS